MIALICVPSLLHMWLCCSHCHVEHWGVFLGKCEARWFDKFVERLLWLDKTVQNGHIPQDTELVLCVLWWTYYWGVVETAGRKSNFDKDTSKLSQLPPSHVSSCPRFPTSTVSLSHFHTLNRGSRLGRYSEILSIYSIPLSYLKSIRVHRSIYSPKIVCVCDFQYHSSETALSKRVPEPRRHQTLIRISTSIPKYNPSDGYHRIQDEISICVDV